MIPSPGRIEARGDERILYFLPIFSLSLSLSLSLSIFLLSFFSFSVFSVFSLSFSFSLPLSSYFLFFHVFCHFFRTLDPCAWLQFWFLGPENKKKKNSWCLFTSGKRGDKAWFWAKLTKSDQFVWKMRLAIFGVFQGFFTFFGSIFQSRPLY